MISRLPEISSLSFWTAAPYTGGSAALGPPGGEVVPGIGESAASPTNTGGSLIM